MKYKTNFSGVGGSLVAALALSTSALATENMHFNPDTTLDSVDAVPGDGACADALGRCSLRAAIQEINAGGDSGSISLQAGASYALNLPGSGEDAGETGDMDVSAALTLYGNNAMVDANTLDRAFDVHAGASMKIYDLQVSNGKVYAESGGGLRSSGTLMLIKSVVMNSIAEGPGASGGAVFNDGGILVLRKTELTGSSAERAGGAIEANGGDTKIYSSEMSGNETGPAPGNGGALHLTGAGKIFVTRSRVENNVAASEGGGLWNSGMGTMTIAKTEVIANTALGDSADNGGGGLFNDGGQMYLRSSDVTRNSAEGTSGSGGGLFNNDGKLNLYLTNVTDNTANRAGGAIEAVAGSTIVFISRLIDNHAGDAPGNGGGLHLTGEGIVAIERSEVAGNSASAEGGGLWNSGVGSMTVMRSSVFNNSAHGNDADQGGGGVFNDGGFLKIERSAIDNNIADGSSGSGGGVFNNGGTLKMTRTDVSENISQRAGGGIEANTGMTRLERVSLNGNLTGASPGNGGGFHLTGPGRVFVNSSWVNDNEADAEGGGLWNSSTGKMIVTGTSVDRNMAPIGPDVFNDGGDFRIDGVDVPAGP